MSMLTGHTLHACCVGTCAVGYSLVTPPSLLCQELSLPDIPVLMTLLDERPSGKLCVSYQKQTVVDAVDEIRATTQRIPNLDIARVSSETSSVSVRADLSIRVIAMSWYT